MPFLNCPRLLAVWVLWGIIEKVPRGSDGGDRGSSFYCNSNTASWMSFMTSPRRQKTGITILLPICWKVYHSEFHSWSSSPQFNILELNRVLILWLLWNCILGPMTNFESSKIMANWTHCVTEIGNKSRLDIKQIHLLLRHLSGAKR